MLLFNFNIRSIGANFYTFNCFTNQVNKRNGIPSLSFSESWQNNNNKNLKSRKYIIKYYYKIIETIEGHDAFHNIRDDGCRGGGLSVYVSNPK